MEWVAGVLGGILLLVFGFVKFKGKSIDKKVDDTLKQDIKDTKQVKEDIVVLDKQEHQVEIKEAQVDQQLADLKDSKIDESDIANFIDAMEKKAKND